MRGVHVWLEVGQRWSGGGRWLVTGGRGDCVLLGEKAVGSRSVHRARGPVIAHGCAISAVGFVRVPFVLSHGTLSGLTVHEAGARTRLDPAHGRAGQSPRATDSPRQGSPVPSWHLRLPYRDAGVHQGAPTRRVVARKATSRHLRLLAFSDIGVAERRFWFKPKGEARCGDNWVVPGAPRSSLAGWHVRRCCLGARVDLVLAASARGDAAKALVSFTGNVQLIAGSDSQVLDVQGPKEGLARLLGTYGMTVSTCTISDDGTLVIAFEDGWTLRCDPDPSYEAWEMRTHIRAPASHPGGPPRVVEAGLEWIVCQPGGGISVRS